MGVPWMQRPLVVFERHILSIPHSNYPVANVCDGRCPVANVCRPFRALVYLPMNDWVSPVAQEDNVAPQGYGFYTSLQMILFALKRS